MEAKRHRTDHGNIRRDISNRKHRIEPKGPQFRLNPGHELKTISEYVKRAEADSSFGGRLWGATRE